MRFVRIFTAVAGVLLLACATGRVTASGDHPVTSSVTIWTEKGELFIEYQLPVAGKPARFTAHLTELNRFRAVVRATVTIRLHKGAGPVVEGKVDAPARPGIFQPVLTLPEPGEYTGEMIVSGPDLEDRFELESVKVIKEGEHPPHEDEEEGAGEKVSFLKEQQWKIPFRTVLAQRKKLVHSIHALGELKDRPGNAAEITAPVDGRIVSAAPIIGQEVKRGQVLVEIAPALSQDVARPRLDQELTQAEAELTQAKSTLSRTEGLVSRGAMPAKELSAAKTAVVVAESKVEAAKQQMQAFLATQQRSDGGPATNHFKVLSPIDGEVTKVEFTPNRHVTRDRLLLEIDNLSRVWVELRVFEPDLPAVREATSAVFTFPGFEKPFTLEELAGKLVHVGHHIEVGNRTAPVVFDIANPKHAFPIGGFAEADILTAKSGSYLAVPVEALMEDGNRTTIYVHTSGEEFEKREVTTGLKDRGWVAINEGVKTGERVVTTGAYEIKLSTISGAIPEHGHTH
jgi:membrane fusion protein, heavy metal efflux system